MTAAMDEDIGKIIAAIEQHGMIKNTLIIFFSDNGTAQGEKVFNAGMRGKKGSPYDGGHRVPCFLTWPAGGFTMPAI